MLILSSIAAFSAASDLLTPSRMSASEWLWAAGMCAVNARVSEADLGTLQVGSMMLGCNE
eukprot:1159398-Pelagomonas_calceolata.AAC.11